MNFLEVVDWKQAGMKIFQGNIYIYYIVQCPLSRESKISSPTTGKSHKHPNSNKLGGKNPHQLAVVFADQFLPHLQRDVMASHGVKSVKYSFSTFILVSSSISFRSVNIPTQYLSANVAVLLCRTNKSTLLWWHPCVLFFPLLMSKVPRCKMMLLQLAYYHLQGTLNAL